MTTIVAGGGTSVIMLLLAVGVAVALEGRPRSKQEAPEALSTFNPDQIEEVRKVNKGKFKRNSRYVVEGEESPPLSKKRKAKCAEDTESDKEILVGTEGASLALR